MLDKNGTISFGGTQLPGIVVESAPALSRPKRKQTTYSVPGRSGDIVIDQNAWSDYKQDYKVFVSGGEGDASELISNVTDILFSGSGYQRLEDSFEPDIFRLAYFSGPLDVTDILTEVGRTKITFTCRPERFLKSGELPVVDPDLIDNPTAYAAKPLVKVEGTGNGSVSINGETMTINDMVDYLYIDCETMNVYRSEGENRNGLVSGDFFKLAPGTNTITFSGGVTSVTVTPRFWKI